ncbi:hypothetical protein [Candidatus Rariloculus sp.]|uniref:hypothetical protein n=1 Tax=Candidatus Rariloculus sp. TaxID=3101265 RepID=UPI003D09B6D0
MSELLTEDEIQSLATLYEMGAVWAAAKDAERLLAVRTVERAWTALPWLNSPFNDSTVAASVGYVLGRAARFVLENQGALGVGNGEINGMLEPFLFLTRAVPMAFDE